MQKISDNFGPIFALVPWLPHWVVGGLIFIAILAAASLLQQLVVWYARRQFARLLVRQIFNRTRPIIRFASVLFAVAVALPLVPLPLDVDDAIRRAMTALLVVLLGWIAIVAANSAVDRHVSRYRLDVDDNLSARKAVTQMRLLKRVMNGLLIVLTVGFALMTFDSVRQYGISLFASAGVAGIVAGLAARPVLSNLMAGMQIALTQPIRLDDVVVVDGELGWIEEINSTYVVVRLWDWRRQIVPLTYFLENVYTNWTRSSAAIIGNVLLYADYGIPVERVREKLNEIVKQSKLWDGNIVNLQVTDATERTIQLRALVSAKTSAIAWDLRCEVREKLISFIQRELPASLPRARNETLPNTLESRQTARVSRA